MMTLYYKESFVQNLNVNERWSDHVRFSIVIGEIFILFVMNSWSIWDRNIQCCKNVRV